MEISWIQRKVHKKKEEEQKYNFTNFFYNSSNTTTELPISIFLFPLIFEQNASKKTTGLTPLTYLKPNGNCDIVAIFFVFSRYSIVIDDKTSVEKQESNK